MVAVPTVLLLILLIDGALNSHLEERIRVAAVPVRIVT